MIVKELIDLLGSLEPDKKITVACDEEWNTIFSDVRIAESVGEKRQEHNNYYVIFGCSGSEINE